MAQQIPNKYQPFPYPRATYSTSILTYLVAAYGTLGINLAPSFSAVPAMIGGKPRAISITFIA